MKYLDINRVDLGAESGEDAMESAAALTARLQALKDRLGELATDGDELDRAGVQLDMARTLVALGRGADAWDCARSVLDTYIAAEKWERAVETCDVLFLSEQPGSLSALGQAVWLAVTYPIDPELTVAVLQHVIDETPDDADGAAVAAAAAAYVVELRAQGKQREELAFFCNQMLGSVARRHADVQEQEQFEAWVGRLELSDPARFLPRLRNVVDVLVQDDWWFDREALQARLPVN